MTASAGLEDGTASKAEAVCRGLHDLQIMKIAVEKRSYRPLRQYTVAISLPCGLTKGETAGQGS